MAIPTSIESGKAQVFDQNPYDSPERRLIYARILQDHEDEAKQQRLNLSQLGSLKSSSAKLLPIDQVEASKMYGDIENHYVANRKKNIDPTNPKNIEAYIENERLRTKLSDFINERSTHAKLAYEARKIVQDDKTGYFDKETSFPSIDEWAKDPNRDPFKSDLLIPAINPLKTKGEAVTRLMKAGKWVDVVDQKTGKTKTVRAPNGTLENQQEFRIDEDAVLDEARLINDPNTVLGRTHIKKANESISTLPAEKRDQIYGELAKHYENFDPAKMDQSQKTDAARLYWHDIIKNNLPEGTRVLGIRDPFVPNTLAKEKNSVTSATSVSENDSSRPIFNNEPGSITRTDIKTPLKGDNDQMSFSSKGGFTIDGNQKHGIDTRGKSLKGTVLSVVSQKNKKTGLKDVYAEVETNSLTNKDINPGLYRALLAKQREHDNEIKINGVVPDELTDAEEDFLKHADDKAPSTMFVPFRAVAKNYQADLKRYNKKDIIAQIEKEHGIKFTDYIPVEKKAVPPVVGKEGNNEFPGDNPPPKKTEIQSSKIAELAKERGYTEKEYRKLLKEKGIKIIN